MASQIEGVRALSAYRLLEGRTIRELNSEGMILEHKKTGAKLFLLSNEDENKVFCIGFRTPPKDSTGVPHILEHSVLCGSEKFPVKDPFVELVKGSLNTFLNAMTYPDKTVYPVASCNEKDFQNLMDVYMDAVLNPNIGREEKIFMQEGWHYELADAESEITYNGVVYNEMKGVFSSPESVLDRYTKAVMFPDTCYGFESGGDPEEIVTLTYQDYLDFYHKYYHPSNSYIYLYGDMDMAEKLKWLDREYLGKYERVQTDSVIGIQPAFKEPVEREFFYSVTEAEDTRNATYLSVNTSAGNELSPKEYIAFQILEYVLLDAPGAPLKQALLDAGIGNDIMGGYENGILQPYFSVIAKNADKEQKGEFLAVVKGTLRKLALMGLDKRSVLAGINYYEFQYREADFGSAPKGLMYGLQCLDSWLYGGDPLMHLEYEETFAALKKGAGERYFEELISKYLLDNPYEAVVIVSPKRNLTAEMEAETAEHLRRYKESLSEEEIRDLVRQSAELKEYQDTPSSKEDLEKIPMLRREDIDKKAAGLIFEEKKVDGIVVVRHNLFTSGIGYLKVLFGTDRVPAEDLPYVGLLKSVLGYVDTMNYSYADLTSEIFLNSGGVSLSVTSYPRLADGGFTGVFAANVRVLYEKLEFGFEILSEILTRSKLDDEKRLREILNETKSKAQMKLLGAGHTAAVARATSYFSDTSYFNDITGGIGFYQFLEGCVRDYDVRKQEIIAGLKRVMAAMLTRDNMTVSYTADDTGYAHLPDAMKLLSWSLPLGTGTVYPFATPGKKRNEGFLTSSKVNYVARCGAYHTGSYPYTGALRILKILLSYDYLWINIRVKGGAYGCMSGIGRSGEGYFVSYRDPNVKESDEVYLGIADYLEQFAADERDMTKYVIGTISDLDMPLSPSLKGARGLSAWYSGVTDEMLQKERNEILSVTVEDIRALAGYVREILKTGAVCAIGNEDKIKSDREMFGELTPLFNSMAVSQTDSRLPCFGRKV
ncbi:insulinase family protein [bacterium 1XD42-94]|nr:insulinase family protein [bacterium 1XD42-76]NBK05742.1 insulinase family protein [bacterium 1XD42-94]